MFFHGDRIGVRPQVALIEGKSLLNVLVLFEQFGQLEGHFRQLGVEFRGLLIAGHGRFESPGASQRLPQTKRSLGRVGIQPNRLLIRLDRPLRIPRI